MRKLFSILAVCAAALIPALALAAPSLAAPAGSRVFVGEHFFSQNVYTGYWLHAHALNAYLYDTSSADEWFIKDPQTWHDIVGGQYVTTVEIALDSNHGYCVAYDNSSNHFYVRACQSGFGDGSQQFWVPVANSRGDWLINAYGSAHNRQYVYVTDTLNADRSLIGEFAGWGDQAVFADH